MRHSCHYARGAFHIAASLPKQAAINRDIDLIGGSAQQRNLNTGRGCGGRNCDVPGKLTGADYRWDWWRWRWRWRWRRWRRPTGNLHSKSLGHPEARVSKRLDGRLHTARLFPDADRGHLCTGIDGGAISRGEATVAAPRRDAKVGKDNAVDHHAGATTEPHNPCGIGLVPVPSKKRV